MSQKLKTKVSMIGVGKLGQSCAEVMANTYEVVGYDLLNRDPINFSMVDSIEKAVNHGDIIFIAAPTPHEQEYDGRNPTHHLPNKDFNYTIVKNILKEVNKYASKKKLVVLISTVIPGTIRRELKPLITNSRFVYNPYLIAMGSVQEDFTNPEMIMIGTKKGVYKTALKAQQLESFYNVICGDNHIRMEFGTWEEIEAMKIFYMIA